MSAIKRIDLTEAEKAFAVANTPLFLLRKLRSDSVLQDLTRTFSAEEIYDYLKVALKREPMSFAESVLPYALLVALSFNEDNSYLRKTRELSAQHYRWFAYLSDLLNETFRPTSVETIELDTGEAITSTSTANTLNQLTVNKDKKNGT